MHKVWWLGSSDGKGNFGDVLTPYILDYFNINYKFVKKHADADLLCVGSIARRANSKTTVLGSGIISQRDKLSIHANWILVRGPLTRKRILDLGGNCPEIYGDPALLLPLFLDESKKEYDLGLVPHHIDFGLIRSKYPNKNIIQLRDVHKSPLEAAKEITKCRKIISSSLHGIIAAHAYNIPAAWVSSENKLKGDDSKFYDYFASVGIEHPQKTTIEDPVFTVPNIDLKPNLINAFKGIQNV